MVPFSRVLTSFVLAALSICTLIWNIASFVSNPAGTGDRSIALLVSLGCIIGAVFLMRISKTKKEILPLGFSLLALTMSIATIIATGVLFYVV